MFRALAICVTSSLATEGLAANRIPRGDQRLSRTDRAPVRRRGRSLFRMVARFGDQTGRDQGRDRLHDQIDRRPCDREIVAFDHSLHDGHTRGTNRDRKEFPPQCPAPGAPRVVIR